MTTTTRSAAIAAPFSGKLVPLSDVPDETFASGVLGEGIAIEPSDGLFCSPVDGTVETDDGMREVYTSLLDGASWHRPDHYFLLLDYRSYYDAKLRAINEWSDREAFGRKCLMNIAAAGKFSSDRAVRDYAENIWHI